MNVMILNVFDLIAKKTANSSVAFRRGGLIRPDAPWRERELIKTQSLFGYREAAPPRCTACTLLFVLAAKIVLLGTAPHEIPFQL